MAGKGASARALSKPEIRMRETICYLLSLPQEEREAMEQAENYTFTMEHPAPETVPGSRASRCGVLEADTVAAAKLLERVGFNVVLLSFAHGYNCGGGFEHAGGSQEEAIFRSTSIFLSLWPHRRKDDGPGVLRRGAWIGDFDAALPRKEPFYEHTECGAIYSPHVRIVEGLASDVGRCPKVAVLTVAAQDVGRVKPFRQDLLREKIRTTLWVAATQGHDAVVLGAFGCGYFGNPPEAVADTCEDVLNTEFKGVFHCVVFALLRDRNFSSFAKRFPVVTEEDLASLTGRLAGTRFFTLAPDPALGTQHCLTEATMFMMTSLPQAWILSDIVFCLLFGSYVPLHSVFAVEPASLANAAGPVLATLTMAAAGLNTWILLVFVAVSCVTAPYVAYAWTLDQLMACLYVLFLAMLVEHRATLLHARSTFQPSGYKALISRDEASANASRVDWLNSRYTAESLSRAGTASDNEDMSTPLPKESQGLLDQLMSRIRGDRAGPVSSIFARVNNAAPSVTSSAPKHRFSADKVQQPGAAAHEAPQFADKETMEFLPGPQMAVPCVRRSYAGVLRGNVFERTKVSVQDLSEADQQASSER
ncbi:unnamed protein product [Effrenium voratum]|nr:unnamed protein product [Effrenium voratum]